MSGKALPMPEKAPRPMPKTMFRHRKNRLFFKVYFYFAVMVVLVASIIGGLFLNFYQSSTRRQYFQQLKSQANSISARFQEFIANEDYGSCRSYMEILLEMGNYEVWSLSNPYAQSPMPDSMATINFVDINQENYTNLIYSAFLGKERLEASYSEIHDCTMLSAGVPIVGKDGSVCGALLISTSMETQDDLIRNSKYMIFYSILAALAISFGVSFLFAGQISRPVSKMRDTALLLAAGDYNEKTGIKRNDEIGELAGTIDFLAEKLTENENVRKNLEQMRMDFFANVSHELRTPITVVQAYTETLLDGVVTEEEKVRQYYGRMLTECKSMERLVGDLLLLSKMQNPDFHIDKEPVNLVQIFDEIIRSADAIGAAKNIRIEVKREKDMYMMQGDYYRLRQMFLVIFDNAVKFSPEGSTVHVSLWEMSGGAGMQVGVSIRDEGIGISQEELPSIFEKFYKSKLRQNAKGSGLGLAIAKQIALKHGGDIAVRSDKGHGTEFVFTFDLMSEDELSQYNGIDSLP